MIKVVLFDVNGVLVPRIRFSIHLAKDYGISLETTALFLMAYSRSAWKEKLI